MKAIEISGYGPAKNLVLCERDKPSPADGEVLIKVHAAGVNRPDIIQRLGKYPPPPGITDIPGLEVAGEVVQSRSQNWKKGDKVCALIAGGGYAEYAVAPAGQCLPVPDTLTMTEAAALPETMFTVWNNLFKRGRLQQGETVLIHGGSSGIGTIGIQMAKAWDATVIVTAGTDEKCRGCRTLGADLAINYKEEDFVSRIEAEYGKDSVNVVMDMVGGDYIAKNISLLAPDGRHVSIAFLNGSKGEIDIREIMIKRLVLTGSTLRTRPVTEKTVLRNEIQDNIWPLAAKGTIRPELYRTFSLKNAAQAHKTLEDGHHIGKIVLNMI